MNAGRVIKIPAGTVLSKAELAKQVPEYGIVRLRREANGQLTPMLQTWKPEARLTKDLPRQLGIELDYNTLLRLVLAGFIKSRRTAPRLTLVCISSLMDHLKASEDPDFWNEERMRRWREVNREGI